MNGFFQKRVDLYLSRIVKEFGCCKIPVKLLLVVTWR